MSHFRISLVHTTGNPNSRNAALALAEVGLLSEVITTFGYSQDSEISQLIRRLPNAVYQHLESELSRRTWIAPPGVKLQTHPWQEIVRVILLKTPLGRHLGLTYKTLIQWLCVSLDHHVAKQHLTELDAIYSYEDIAATTFQMAKLRGVYRLYELPVVFYKTNCAIQTEEAERFPELTSALHAVQEPLWKRQRKEQEIQLADHIFVASSFSKQSLVEVGVSPDKISVVPYGAPIDYFYPQPKPDSNFRALFVGSVSPAKGVHYLLQAWQELKFSAAELLLVGVNCFPDTWLSPFNNCFRHIGSVPHTSLNKYYSLANVLVFPSLADGFGLVLLEAMSCGIPIITTSNTGGPDIITDGVEGFIVPIRDVEALKEKLEWCYRHPTELAEMGRAARRRAEQLTWKLYRQTLANKIQKLLVSESPAI